MDVGGDITLGEGGVTFGMMSFATGGWTAAPVVGKVIAQIGPLLGLSPMEQDKMAATERDILKPLGPDLLESLNVTAEDDDASVEVDSDH